jgi:hypothetical protein
MPFTFAHPAAILPFSYLSKKYISFTGLVVGSIIPDFEYFIRFSAKRHYSHTWAGIFWFDLPLALLVCFLFHNVVRDPLIRNLPRPVWSRCVHSLGFNWNKWFRHKWVAVVCSIIVGATLHLIWDRLTHETSETLQQTAYIQSKTIPERDALLYYTYWGINSIVGIALLLVSFWKMPAAKEVEKPASTYVYWIIVLMTGLLILTIRLLLNAAINLVDFVDSVIASFLIGFFLASFTLLKKKLN